MALHVAKASTEFIRKLAKEYVGQTRHGKVATMKQLAEKYNTSPKTISDILFRGIAEGIIDEITSIEIGNKATSSTDNLKKTRNRWVKALDLRNIQTMEEEISFLKQSLTQFNFQLQTYDAFFSSEQGAPSKAYLRSQKAIAENKIRKLQDRIITLKG